ncbi:NFX1-type zinc finger-containing protein 1 [Selaginella moellendorffii]|uniref:NFX1-type zinc finger-containing protein 1 n=1 Tax=Selaginella moellendorffii TaxID=88036 RepID=UPI000D1C77F4|nr:NFX1-type zinc finger-containing protein 1 [Selaginella moellendorffii]|eukprot:XP_024528675.1 NFX1-type zinc finger-containing protein 1 [Selaginella moellendorffii]
MENIPFKSHLISLVKHVKEPAYLPQRAEGDRYDFSSAFPGGTKEFGQFKFHILQDWPEWNSTLDSSQVAALKHALTKNLALIQGPPGTGKTFVGMLIVKLLLANLKREATKTRHFSTAEDVPDLCGPVLIVCYTNHALDQFLEGIFRSEKNVIRIGGRSKNKQLDGRNLQNLLQLARENRDVQGAYVRKAVAARDDRRRLEAEIRRCVDELNLPYVTETLLHGVATEDQITNLFYLGRTSALAGKKVVEAWLEAENLRYVDVPARRVEQVANRYAVLDDEVEAADLHDQTVNVPREEGRRTQGLAAPGDGGWVHVQTRRRNRPVEAVEQQQDPVVNNAHRDEVPLELLVDYPDVWSLPLRERKRLHEYWLDEIHANAQKELTRFKQEYEAACIECKAADSEIQLSLLRRAKVIGMTTTAAARLHDILVALKPEIVVVEEAAEVLESHILACISPYTKHLILIGDHLQLRPSVATFRLAQRHKLDVSMFERLVQSGVEHTMLKTQRRMKPCIAKLISSIYPQLRNHPSVLEYEDVKGVKSSLFFLDHNAPEEAGHEAGSKVNLAEAKLVVELCSYLLKQEAYAPGDMTILTMYKGQVQEISRRLKDRFQCRRVTGRPLGPEAENSEATDSWMPRVSSVDDFQGEENDIILLSLVRSNLVPGKEDEGTIGFLKTGNRVCVALSRARKGLYIFGNAQLLALKSPLWKGILHGLHQDGLMGSKLVLCCQNHPGVETSVQHAEDFLQVGDGGCSRPCEYQLECGHACPRRCHPESHDTFICPKMCLKPYDGCTHRCVKSCHGREDPACPPCKEPVLKTFPTCGHEQSVPCSTDPAKLTCRSPCKKLLSCGHACPEPCGLPCAKLCRQVVRKELPCGHATKMMCPQDPWTFSCLEPCRDILPDCEHRCGGTCGKCKQGTEHIPCQRPCKRDLFCGHQCKARCSASCPPCSEPCQKRCLHSRCAAICGAPCKQCLEPCSWNCRHFSCTLLCCEICQRPRCDRPCTKRLVCGHPCIGLCGEPCPSACRVCQPGTFDAITQLTLEESESSDRFVELLDCGHIFEVTGLDQWMDMDDSAETCSKAIVLKFCPACKTPVRKSFRYANVVKKKLHQIELVKMKVYGHEQTRAGMGMLSRKEYRQAFQIFTEVIKNQPGNFEAHLGMAQALRGLKEFGYAVTHLRFIAERSSLAADIRSLPVPRLKRPYTPVPSSLNLSFVAVPSRSLTIQALIQWGSALTSLTEFSDAVRLCEIVLKHDSTNGSGKRLKEMAEKRLTHQVVEAVSAEFSARGHWYQCPNGHVYVVGECGGPMQTSHCPDCGSIIGGEHHQSAAGNTHSTIDGSDHALYSDHTEPY